MSSEERAAITRVCRFICHKNVAELERLATAAWIRKREGVEDTDEVALRLNELKPHISVADARESDLEIVSFLQEK